MRGPRPGGNDRRNTRKKFSFAKKDVNSATVSMDKLETSMWGESPTATVEHSQFQWSG
jgi:hypothetical protein